jgi:hypothetical protein
MEAMMAGTFEITDSLCWMPAGWIYDNILKSMADVLGREGPLGSLLLDSLTTANGGYRDARNLSADDLTLLCDAAKTLASQVKCAGPLSFAIPDGFRAYVRDLDELVQMLSDTARMKIGKGQV